MSKISIAKTLEKCCEFEKKDEKIAALRANADRSPIIFQILKYMFDPNIKFLLPKGSPPYKELDFDEPGRLYVEARKLYLFIEGGHPTLTQLKRESLFISLLENISPEDAKLLVAMKEKKSPYKGLTKNLVSTAFPGLIPDE
jgi:hypothetical protein